MRFLIVLLILSATALGQTSDERVSCSGRKATLTNWYAQEVFRALEPPEPSRKRILIRVSLLITGQPKLVMWTDGDTFDLYRGTPDQDVYKFLDELDRNCGLPADPIEAAKLVKVNWNHSTVSSTVFAQIHTGFVDSVSKNGVLIRQQYSVLLKDRVTYLNVHTAQYLVTYDNGYQRLAVTADDTTKDPRKMNPVIAWAHSLEKLADKVLSNKPN